MPVPSLATHLTGPLLELERRFLAAQPQIEHWFRNQWSNHQAPFYGSVDLRNSGFKLAPVDMNLFPGGFNNLNPDALPLAVQAVASAVEHACPRAKSILLIPENHTRNTFYLKNIAALRHILETAGLQVRLGSLSPDINEITQLDAGDGVQLTLEPLHREGDRVTVGTDGFDPCIVLLNNDLSAGIPDILQGIKQTLLPPLHGGWAVRRKTQHFSAFDQVATEFASLLDLDPWLINPYFAGCRALDFHERHGEDELADTVSDILQRIGSKYREYEIDVAPFVIVKADAGTYGMGVMTAKSPDDVRGLNRKQRNKMSVIKEGQQVSEVIVQEGVYTFETVGEAVAEPVIYMMDRHVVGGFYRVHTGRGRDENLNAPGMHFSPMSFDGACLPDRTCGPEDSTNRLYAYGVVARLALLAGAIELKRTAPTAA
ncbi:glutamate--cysteine ligase [Aquaspirillum serpens]|uniref:glutamate--cysteine ligase n=1 Tax=Aquaspirillum serpens TaxID=190 RepID=UPI0003B6835A|nr:glutamate--cysteine ligase [Aquaspirillum serpens]